MTANKAITSIKLSSMKGEARVDSRIIANELGIKHINFIETLNKYESELKELGQLPFKTEVGYRQQGGGNPQKYALLNEDQAVFALTLSRNNPTVVACKLALTKAFKQARTIANNQTNPEWCQLRLELKFTHRAFTDALKALCEYAHTRGSESTQDKFQMSYAKLLKQTFGYANRDTLDGLMLKTVEEAERLTALNIYAGIAANTPYKEIYQQVKIKIEAYAEIVKT